MKILYYNFIQFDNEEKFGGGVTIYLKNLLTNLVQNSNDDIYFLSAGWKYNILKRTPYIKETSNIFGEKCKSFEIINSPIIAPISAIYMNPKKNIEDEETYKILDDFIQSQGGFDVIHFHNMEGLSINVLKLKEKYPNTKFILSVHNYTLICAGSAQYFQYQNNRKCEDYKNGTECMHCKKTLPTKKLYKTRCRNYYKFLKEQNKKFLWFCVKLLIGILAYKAKNYIGSSSTMKPEYYVEYRKHNIEMLNKYADAIFAVSERVRQIMIQQGCNPQKVITSYIGTKFAENELGHSVAQQTKPFTIAYMGYERYDKGFFFFVDSLSKLDEEIAKDINVVLAVKNIHKENYEEKLKSFNDVIVYNGYTHDNLSQILSNVNLGVVPVLWEDNLPQVAIEMVAFGVPILCSDFGGASELCNNDLFKFKGGDEQDFRNKLVGFVKNPELLEKYWENHPPLMTMEKHVKELMNIYK